MGHGSNGKRKEKAKRPYHKSGKNCGKPVSGKNGQDKNKRRRKS